MQKAICDSFDFTALRCSIFMEDKHNLYNCMIGKPVHVTVNFAFL